MRGQHCPHRLAIPLNPRDQLLARGKALAIGPTGPSRHLVFGQAKLAQPRQHFEILHRMGIAGERHRKRPDFGAALKEAMRDLTSQERSLLRLHFLDGLSFNQIGAVYQVNKSTISRRMAHARETLLTKTRETLEKRFNLGAPELESLLRMLGPELQLSLTSVLIHTPAESL